MSEETKNTEAQVETPESQEVVTETTPVSEEITAAEGTTEAAAVSEETSEVAQSPEDFLNNFDWHKYEEGIEAVDESQLKEFEKALEGTVGSLTSVM